MTTFSDRLAAAVRNKQSLLVVGLDPNLEKIPEELIMKVWEDHGRLDEGVAYTFVEFNRDIIAAVAPHAVAVKPQIAFYEQYGSWGMWAFEETIRLAKAAGLLVISDGKRVDGGDTADAYAAGHLGMVPYFAPSTGGFELRPGPLRTDALTVHGYIGDDCVTRFAAVARKNGGGLFIVDKTSFKPNSRLEQMRLENGLTVWQALAELVDEWGRDTEGTCGYRDVGVVLGATYPEDAPWMRQRLPNSWFLVPGYGAQGGGADAAVAAVNPDGLGCCINSSRGVIYAYREAQYAGLSWQSAAAAAARDARNDLNDALRRAGKFTF